MDDGEFVKCMTAKEIKKLAKPEFAADPDKFYPTKTLRKLGFSRTQCVECKGNFWRHLATKETCGDSQCEKMYSFIGVGHGRGRKGGKLTYAEAYKTFERSLSSARVPCTPIPRYPVVARWRADVDYVAAGIFCFQPYCVTGELEPPANPLICPQFCLRFNDLDNIGLTGRHYSGFVMLGIQVFNSPGNYKFWMDECVEFNFRWLTEELEIEPDEITFIEDVWAGGGNLGPSIEYFVSGLELGNMVFMQFKTFPDGSREPLDVKVIDCGIGLERVPWLINGSATSYMDVYPGALAYFQKETGTEIDTAIWDKYGPYSCMLNVDEVEDIEETWRWISEQIGVPAESVKSAIEPVKDMYVVLDHTRCALMAITDGSLPSNVGGASNVRNILRRCFSIMDKYGWLHTQGTKTNPRTLDLEKFNELFEQHKVDLAQLYGAFTPYESFAKVIYLEYTKWKTTDASAAQKLQRLLKKNKGKGMSIDDWIVAVTSWGLPAEIVAKVTKMEVPGNLYYEIADRQERTVRAEAAVLYSTGHLPPTQSTYYYDHTEYTFNAKILEVFPNVTRNNEPSIVVLNQSAFYPTSGGQEHDVGSLTIDGKEYEVVDVTKVGPAILHTISPPLPGTNLQKYKGKKVSGVVDEERRNALRTHHTATHIVYASCRAVLGPHVWQHGAKKTTKQAHLDITHFESLTFEETQAIQMEANRIVQRCRQITKGFMPKDEAEKKYGFHLYQGGVVPGNELRVVDIEGTDTEACCGTHCDNTAEVGNIKITKAVRISDGILRLYFVAGERALLKQKDEAAILNALTSSWSIPKSEIKQTAERFFDGYKKLSTQTAEQARSLVKLQLALVLADPSFTKVLIRTNADSPTLYVGMLPNFVSKFKAAGKSIAFVGATFLLGIAGNAADVDCKSIQSVLESVDKQAAARAAERSQKAGEDGKAAKAQKSKGSRLISKTKITLKEKNAKGKTVKVDVTGIATFDCFTYPAEGNSDIVEELTRQGFREMEN